jgi:cytochrome bd-type quinol oxidase subunit 2
MPDNHLLAMTLYGLLTAAFFAVLWRTGRRERLRYFALVFFALMLGAVALGWLMYPFPAHP